MKKSKFSYLLVVLAVMLFFAVSIGGCGGSSSSDDSSSEEGFDVDSEEESIDRFPSLNGTEWQVSRVLVKPDEGSETFSVVEISPAGKIKLSVNGDALSLVDSSSNTPYDAVTGRFKDSAGNEITVPLIQSASGFKQYIDAEGWTHQTSLNVSANGYRASAEHLRIVGQDTSILEVTFGITFTRADSNGVTHSYQSYIELLPSTGDDNDYGGNDDWVDITDKFSQLDGTKWEVISAQANEGSGLTYKSLKMVKNSLNAKTLTLAAMGDVMGWKDSRGVSRVDPVTAKFVTSAGQTITVPLLRTSYSIKKSSNTLYDYEGIAADGTANGPTVYLEIVGKYWPFSEVNIDSTFSVDGVRYGTHLHLMPVK
ncbi:MAG: hypothetical protein IJR85_04250 [Synergistaceae bacterium]|nr:hypothetical protein [Synergistaceae bacterium]